MRVPPLLSRDDVLDVFKRVVKNRAIHLDDFSLAYGIESLVREKFTKENENSHLRYQLLHCPLCGKVPSLANVDTLYSSGLVWYEDSDGNRFYTTQKSMPESKNLCYEMNCVESSGGCGMIVTGDSKEEVLKKWQTRA